MMPKGFFWKVTCCRFHRWFDLTKPPPRLTANPFSWQHGACPILENHSSQILFFTVSRPFVIVFGSFNPKRSKRILLKMWTKCMANRLTTCQRPWFHYCPLDARQKVDPQRRQLKSLMRLLEQKLPVGSVGIRSCWKPRPTQLQKSSWWINKLWEVNSFDELTKEVTWRDDTGSFQLWLQKHISWDYDCCVVSAIIYSNHIGAVRNQQALIKQVLGQGVAIQLQDAIFYCIVLLLRKSRIFKIHSRFSCPQCLMHKKHIFGFHNALQISCPSVMEFDRWLIDWLQCFALLPGKKQIRPVKHRDGNATMENKHWKQLLRKLHPPQLQERSRTWARKSSKIVIWDWMKLGIDTDRCMMIQGKLNQKGGSCYKDCHLQRSLKNVQLQHNGFIWFWGFKSVFQTSPLLLPSQVQTKIHHFPLKRSPNVQATVWAWSCPQSQWSLQSAWVVG